MKKFKINEDVQITDPDLAQQYNRGKSMLIQKDKLIVQLQQKINDLNKQKMEIEKELNKVEVEAARKQGEVVDQTQQTQQTQQPVEGTQQAQPVAEGILIKIKGDEITLEIDELSDKLTYLETHDGNPEEIETIQSELDDRIAGSLMTDQRFVDDEDDMEDETRYSDDVEEPEEEEAMLTDDYGYEELEEGYDDEEPRFTGMMGRKEDNYELSPSGKPLKKRKPISTRTHSRKQKAWSDARIEKYEALEREIENLQDEIEGIEQDIQYSLERYDSPSFEGAEGETEEFWAHLSHEEREILNTGMYNNKERLKELKKLGSEDPEGILNDYFYYYPEFDEEVQKQKKQAEKEADIQRKEIDKIRKKLEKKETQLENMGYPRYMDESVYNPMAVDDFYDMSEAYVEDATDISRSKEEFLDNDYLFYVKVIQDDGGWFIGKVFKVNPDGDWFGVVKAGDDEGFEKMSYETDWDEIDIAEFLEEQYDAVEIIDRHEFDDYLEDKDKEDVEEVEEEVIGGGSWPSNTI